MEKVMSYEIDECVKQNVHSGAERIKKILSRLSKKGKIEKANEVRIKEDLVFCEVAKDSSMLKQRLADLFDAIIIFSEREDDVQDEADRMTKTVQGMLNNLVQFEDEFASSLGGLCENR